MLGSWWFTALTSGGSANSKPILTGFIPDVAYFVGDGDKTVDVSEYFSGATSYALTEAVTGVSILGSVVTISTDAAMGENVGITATNANGSRGTVFSVLVTEPLAAPTVATPIADQSFDLGSGDKTLDVSANFTGNDLVFTITGAGATITDTSGIITLGTGAEREAVDVTVTATNTAGEISDTFTLTVSAPSTEEPVAVTTAYAQIIGTTTADTTVDIGTYTPDRRVWVAQFRSDAMGVLTVDGEVLSPLTTPDGTATVGGLNVAVYVSETETDGDIIINRSDVPASPLAAVWTTTGLSAIPRDIQFVGDLGGTEPGALTIDVVEGGGLLIAARGWDNLTVPADVLPATIADGDFCVMASGVVSATDAALAVNATNDVNQSLKALVVISLDPSGAVGEGGGGDPGDPVAFPAAIADTDWAATPNDLVDGKRRSTVTIDADAIPIADATFQADFVLEVYKGTVEDGEAEWFIPFPSFDTEVECVWNTNSGLPPGTTVWHALRYRRLSDGATQLAAVSQSFLAEGDGTTPDPDPEDPPVDPPEDTGTVDFSAPDNVTLSLPTQTALKQALDNRINSGGSGTFIIGLPDGNYGSLDLNGRDMPSKTILRATSLGGAKFGTILADEASNITFQRIDLNGGYVSVHSSSYIGIEYSRIYGGTIVPQTTHNGGYQPRTTAGVHIYKNGALAGSHHITVRMNLICGAHQMGIYMGGSDDILVEDNVFENSMVDGIKLGSGNNRITIRRNWGARTYWCWFNPGTQEYGHQDWIQVDARDEDVDDLLEEENVFLRGPGGFVNGVIQSNFSSKSSGNRWVYRGNISMSNSVHGLTVDDSVDTYTIQNNTALRCTDITVASSGGQGQTTINTDAGNTGGSISGNVICDAAGKWGSPTVNFVIPTKIEGGGGSYNLNKTLDYFYRADRDATFWQTRPIPGAGCHDKGAYRTWEKVKAGQYPNYGYAYESWKRQYDPLNEIAPAL